MIADILIDEKTVNSVLVYVYFQLVSFHDAEKNCLLLLSEFETKQGKACLA